MLILGAPTNVAIAALQFALVLLLKVPEYVPVAVTARSSTIAFELLALDSRRV